MNTGESDFYFWLSINLLTSCSDNISIHLSQSFEISGWLWSFKFGEICIISKFECKNNVNYWYSYDHMGISHKIWPHITKKFFLNCGCQHHHHYHELRWKTAIFTFSIPLLFYMLVSGGERRLGYAGVA
jgi:hypothetical protein